MTSPAPNDLAPDAEAPLAPGPSFGPSAGPSAAPMALVREVQGPMNDRGRVAGLAMVCSAAGVALGFALAGSLFAAMTPPRMMGVGPAGYSACSRGHGDGHGRRWHGPMAPIAVAPARAWLGVSVDGTTRGAPAELRGVVRGAPADLAGLRPGDVVVRFDGHDVSTASELLALLRPRQPGDVVSLEARGPDGRHVSIERLRLDAMPMGR